MQSLFSFQSVWVYGNWVEVAVLYLVFTFTSFHFYVFPRSLSHLVLAWLCWHNTIIIAFIWFLEESVNDSVCVFCPNFIIISIRLSFITRLDSWLPDESEGMTFPSRKTCFIPTKSNEMNAPETETLLLLWDELFTLNLRLTVYHLSSGRNENGKSC